MNNIQRFHCFKDSTYFKLEFQKFASNTNILNTDHRKHGHETDENNDDCDDEAQDIIYKWSIKDMYWMYVVATQSYRSLCHINICKRKCAKNSIVQTFKLYLDCTIGMYAIP